MPDNRTKRMNTKRMNTKRMNTKRMRNNVRKRDEQKYQKMQSANERHSKDVQKMNFLSLSSSRKSLLTLCCVLIDQVTIGMMRRGLPATQIMTRINGVNSNLMLVVYASNHDAALMSESLIH